MTRNLSVWNSLRPFSVGFDSIFDEFDRMLESTERYNTNYPPYNIHRVDENNYPNYYELSLNLIPSNGIIIIDNMLWHGDVANENKNDSQTNTIRDLNLKIQNDTRVEFSLLPLSDGLSFIRKK